jgi:hypothetical protein
MLVLSAWKECDTPPYFFWRAFLPRLGPIL